MTNYNFSHLFTKPSVLVDTMQKGYRVTDESWLTSIERIEPKLLTESDIEDLRRILDPAIERRGGKSIQSLSEQLIAELEMVNRDDVPRAFVDGLIVRLRSGKKYTKRDSNREYGSRLWRENRDQIIVYLYDYIYDELDEGVTDIDHHIFGTLEVPKDRARRSDKALAILHDLLISRTIYYPPAPSTLLKIVSEARDRKRRPRT